MKSTIKPYEIKSSDFFYRSLGFSSIYSYRTQKLSNTVSLEHHVIRKKPISKALFAYGTLLFNMHFFFVQEKKHGFCVKRGKYAILCNNKHRPLHSCMDRNEHFGHYQGSIHQTPSQKSDFSRAICNQIGGHQSNIAK